MFHILHRVYLVTWSLILLACVGWAYAHSGISHGLADGYVVWQNKPKAGSAPIIPLSGTVTRVLDGRSLTIKGTDKQSYSIALQGLVPVENPGVAFRKTVTPAKARLTELTLSNQVDVVLTSVDEYRRGLGVVYLGRTNVNALLIESGLAGLKLEFIRPLPLTEQYALVRAGRRAQERKLAQNTP